MSNRRLACLRGQARHYHRGSRQGGVTAHVADLAFVRCGFRGLVKGTSFMSTFAATKAAILMVGPAFILAAANAHAQTVTCPSTGPDGPMHVTPDCEDPLYNDRTFVVDKVSEAVAPVAHTRVDGHFTAAAGKPTYKVTFYLPEREKWQGRFFQHAYPLEQPENVDDMSFALRNGAYLVNVAGVMCGCGGYRPDAAAAKIARRYASNFYRTDRRIYGYLWGGSGGGLLVAGALENTQGVWDGAVPYVMPNAASLANVNASGALSGLALSDHLAAIADAVAPGSRVAPSDGLTAEQRAILEEALALGTPLRTFEAIGPFGGSNPLLMILTAGVKEKDPTYVEDFWSKPGYEGVNPPDYLKAAIREEWATVKAVKRDKAGAVESVALDRSVSVGARPLAGISFEYWLYNADESAKIGELSGRLDGSTIWMKDTAGGKTGQLGQGIEALMHRASLGSADKVAPGLKVKVNNLNFLALHFYHRHAMPLDRDMFTYDQFRNPDGTPRYAQRSYLASPESAKGTAGGGTQTGRIQAKAIVVQSMVDGGAQPWMADLYARRVRRALGEKGFAQSFRVYFNDNAGHLDIPPQGQQGASTINYVPGLHQAVLDLSAWVETGKAPPASTQYTVRGGQVVLAATAAKRNGIQPVVDLTAGDADRLEVAVNQPVVFTGKVQAPPRAGKITSTAWWFGDSDFALVPQAVARPKPSIVARQTHAFSKPGTYFVTLWATSQRDGNISETATAVQNLARVRIVVR